MRSLLSQKMSRKILKKEAEDSLIYRCPMCRQHLTFKHRVNQYFHIRSNYKVRENQVICDQSVYDFTDVYIITAATGVDAVLVKVGLFHYETI